MLYVRMKGRAQGPFEIEKLQLMVQRGQVSRVHEVSVDGTTWSKASDYPEIFRSKIEETGSSTDSQPDANHSQQAPVPTATQWYYVENSQQQGPIDSETLKQMLATGKLSENADVWRDGMAEWTPAAQVENLVQKKPQITLPLTDFTPHESQEKSSTDVSEVVVRALGESRPWIVFITNVGFVYAVLAIISGLTSIITGSKTGLSGLVTRGLIMLVIAGICGAGSMMLMNYSRRILQLLTHKTESNLIAALDAVKTFWAFVGIALIVVLVIMVFAILTALALIGEMPSFG